MFNAFGFGQQQAYIQDLFGNAAQACSLKKTKASYTGYCMNVRRSSDNATMDIGFVGENFDFATFNTFIGANTAYVTKFYDQSGNGFHMAQTTASKQPTTDGKSIIFTSTGSPGSQQFLYTTNVFGNSAAAGNYYHFFVTVKMNGPFNSTWSFRTIADYDGDGGGLAKGITIRQGNLNTNPNNMQIVSPGGTPTQPLVYINNVNYANTSQFVVPNNSGLRVYSLLTNGFTTNGGNRYSLGVAGIPDGTYFTINMNVYELIVFNANKSSLLPRIHAEINGRFGAYAQP